MNAESNQEVEVNRSSDRVCPHCDGAGKVYRDVFIGERTYRTARVECLFCRGTGRRSSELA